MEATQAHVHQSSEAARAPNSVLINKPGREGHQHCAVMAIEDSVLTVISTCSHIDHSTQRYRSRSTMSVDLRRRYTIHLWHPYRPDQHQDTNVSQTMPFRSPEVRVLNPSLRIDNKPNPCPFDHWRFECLTHFQPPSVSTSKPRQFVPITGG